LELGNNINIYLIRLNNWMPHILHVSSASA
jgi:hypothetical protein